MNKTALALALVATVGISACSSNTKNLGMSPPADTNVAVKDATISTDFKDQGIKLHYTVLGRLEKIEVFGLAPAWKGNADVLAEADAMDKLVKFVHGQTVSTQRRTKILARSIDRAKDTTSNRFKTADGTVNFNAEELDNSGGDESRQNNVSNRVASRLENTLISTVTSITASGRLTGVRKIRDERKQDGRYYVAVYQWSDKDQGTAEYIRNRMR